MRLAKRVDNLEAKTGGLPRGCQCDMGETSIKVNLYKPGEPFPAKTERPATTTETCPKCGKEREIQHIYITVDDGQGGNSDGG
jgi:hypothetical protein